MSVSTFKKASAEYRKHLPDLSIDRFTKAKDQDPYEYSDTFQTHRHPPWLFDLTQTWQNLYQEPFKGITNDGNLFQRLSQSLDIIRY
jgi:hypothetical protein